MISLARRVVECKNWRWVPGMLSATPPGAVEESSSPLPVEDRNMERTKWLEAERDAALKKVAELTECLRWYVENDDTNEGGKWDESNAHWIAGKRRAQRALGVEEE